ncbi:hypothetical protein ASPCAL11801 [Aspergillus calidoustus]|uniref:Transcription factor domain-containing protein n=1 Tax=Aspergillus calidoustus TaxID=454130 RepID=A0A0U5GDC8_ASPCI|nr:hypothetical protein ASPCAL11801 [Aspergillus calidoustus]
MVLSDACLFHATLFATSSLMDFVQQKRDNPVTLRHKGATIRLINKAVSQAATHGLQDEVIAVTTYLVYFAKLLGDFQDAEHHDAGITAMLEFKGGTPPPTHTYTSYLLRLRDVWNSIVYRVDTLCPSVAGPRASSGCYTSLLAIAIQKQLERPLEQRLPVPLLHFLITFNNQCMSAVGYALPDHSTGPPETTTADLEPQIHNAMQCISITASIYWTAVTRDLNNSCTYNITDNAGEIEKLKAALLHVDNLFWLRSGPEVLRWILMTGAAGATCLADQAFFILRSYMITSIIEPEEMDAFLVGVDHLLWIFNRKDEQVAEGEDRILDFAWAEDVFRQLM